MKIIDFVKGMLPFFPRSRLQEDFRVTSNSLTTLVLPATANAAKEFTGSFKSKEAKDLQIAYKAYVKNVSGQNFFADIADKQKKIKKIMDVMEAQIAQGFDEKIVSVAMTVRKASIIRLVGVIAFTNNFTLSLLNAIAHYENVAAGNDMTYVSDVTPGELQRLNKYIADYAVFMENLSKVKDASTLLDNLPEVLAESELVEGGITKGLDPFGIFGQSNFKGSPMYYFAMNWAEHQHKQYKKMQGQVQTLNKRLMAIKRANQGQTSPELEAQIERDSALIANLTEEIRKYEEALA